jgi:hypothetical protein
MHADDEVVWCHMWLGAFAADNNDFDGAVDYSRRGLDLAQRIGSVAGTVYLANQPGENNIAAAAFLQRPECLGDARAALLLAASTAHDAHIEEGAVRASNGLAILDAPIDPVASLTECHAALSTWRRLGSGNRLIMSLVSAARVALLAHDHTTSASLLAEATDAISAVGWKQAVGRLLEAAIVNAVHNEDLSAAATLGGACSARSMTPRWYVDISTQLDDAIAAGRQADPVAWRSNVDVGAAMTDNELFDIVRQLAANH